jgi:hypothetical protein
MSGDLANAAAGALVLALEAGRNFVRVEELRM